MTLHSPVRDDGVGADGKPALPTRVFTPGTVHIFRVSTEARVWHIVSDKSLSPLALCGASPRNGDNVPVELGIDEHVIAHRGRAVCSRCRCAHKETRCSQR